MFFKAKLTHGQIKALTRYNTPTISNAIDILNVRPKNIGFNLEAVTDFMPDLGAICGYAVTVKYIASQEAVASEVDFFEYFKWFAALPSPKIVVLKDIDSPREIVGSFWGECNANKHRAFGGVGTITDGAIRDLQEMKGLGYKALARRLCVSSAYGQIIDFDCRVNVFGCEIKPGELIHADHHGFITLPSEVAPKLDEVARFYDRNELEFIISICQKQGVSLAEIIENESKFREQIQKFNAESKMKKLS